MWRQTRGTPTPGRPPAAAAAAPAPAAEPEDEEDEDEDEDEDEALAGAAEDELASFARDLSIRCEIVTRTRSPRSGE